MTREPYHSVLADDVASQSAPRINRVQAGPIHAFAHDLASRPKLPEEYDECDVIYCEPPWSPDEADTFRHRADQPVNTVSNLMQRWAFLEPIRDAILSDRNVVVVAGVKVERQLPEATWSQRIRFEGPGKNAQGIVAYAMYWGVRMPLAFPRSTTELIRWLYEDCGYRKLGDPFCGYGRSGALWGRMGGSVVLSDINPRCIGHIALRAAQWVPPRSTPEPLDEFEGWGPVA
jgi:hypothetical protein